MCTICIIWYFLLRFPSNKHHLWIYGRYSVLILVPRRAADGPGGEECLPHQVREQVRYVPLFPYQMAAHTTLRTYKIVFIEFDVWSGLEDTRSPVFNHTYATHSELPPIKDPLYI